MLSSCHFPIAKSGNTRVLSKLRRGIVCLSRGSSVGFTFGTVERKEDLAIGEL